MEVKSKVLKEIMDLMGEKDGDKLKMHPKLMAMKVTKVEPLGKGMMEKKMKGPEDMMEDKSEGESSDLEDTESKIGSDLDELDLESLDPAMLEKLVKLCK